MTPTGLEEIIERTGGGGGEIVGLLKRGSAFEAPGEAVAMMADAILMDRKRLFPCAVLLEGEYGIHDTFVGVLIKLGAGGVEEILELDLSEKELAGIAPLGRRRARTHRCHGDLTGPAIPWRTNGPTKLLRELRPG